MVSPGVMETRSMAFQSVLSLLVVALVASGAMAQATKPSAAEELAKKVIQQGENTAQTQGAGEQFGWNVA
jgi:hypothetical protein